MTKADLLDEVRERVSVTEKMDRDGPWFVASVTYCGMKFSAPGDTGADAQHGVMSKVEYYIDEQYIKRSILKPTGEDERVKFNDQLKLEEYLFG